MTLLRALTDRIAELEAQRDQVLALHTEFEGRCTECVEWCDCLDAEPCTHGHIAWPCKTAAVYSQPSDTEEST